MAVKQRKTLRLSALTSVICALGLAVGGIGAVTSVEAATTHKAPPEAKTMEKPSLSNIKEQAKENAKEKIKEDAKEKVAEKLGIETKQPTKPGMPMKK